MVVLPDHPTLAFAADLALRAGQTLMEYHRAGNFDPTAKSDRSIVTLADVAADRLISSAIQAQFPHDTLISEELSPSYHPHAGQNGVWVIDPLDGTTNFSLGLHFWGVLLARLVDGYPDTAAMYFPLLDELYLAQRGQGAYLNGQRLRAHAPADADKLSFFACCSRTHRHYRVGIRYKTRILGATAYTLCCVARNIAAVGFESTPKLWDLAAPWLLVEEAGGGIATYDPNDTPFPLRSDVDYAHHSFPLLAAATPEMTAWARTQITPRA